jgi:hypothetical protein
MFLASKDFEPKNNWLQKRDKKQIFWTATPCASPHPRPSIFLIFFFVSTTLLTGMTGNSLHMQRALTSQSQGKTKAVFLSLGG